MTVSTVNVRMDADVKRNFEAICSSIGMNLTTAVNIFARRVIREGKIPFELSANFDVSDNEAKKDWAVAKSAFEQMRRQAQNACPQGMSLDEINELIAQTREENRLTRVAEPQ